MSEHGFQFPLTLTQMPGQFAKKDGSGQCGDLNWVGGGRCSRFTRYECATCGQRVCMTHVRNHSTADGRSLSKCRRGNP